MNVDKRTKTITDALKRIENVAVSEKTAAAISLLRAIANMASAAGAHTMTSVEPEMRMLFVNMRFTKSNTKVKPDITVAFDASDSTWDVWRTCKPHMKLSLMFDAPVAMWRHVRRDEDETLSYVATMIAAAIES